MGKERTFVRKDSGIELDEAFEKTGFFDLPAEIRTSIYELIFDPVDSQNNAFSSDLGPRELNENYHASDHLAPLLTCRQFYNDAHLLAFSRTTFVARNPYTSLDLSNRIQKTLRPVQISSIRSIAFVAEARHFRQMSRWNNSAFGVPLLRLTDLAIVLHRSSYWHYLFDFNNLVVSLLRNLQGVARITYMQNRACVKPNFQMWFNRLIMLVLKTDRQERFGKATPVPETTWWEWEFDARAETARLVALPAKRVDMDTGEYEGLVEPLWECLRRSIEVEPEDTDPRSRIGF